MNYIILDMEWNQAKSSRAVVRKPVFLNGEVIQIGAVKLNENFEMTDKIKIAVKPKYYKSMNKKVAALTSITNDDIKNGISFAEASDKLRLWCGDDFLFMTWGPDDMGILFDNHILWGISYGWIPKCINVQDIFFNQIDNGNRQFSLTYAMEKLGIDGLNEHDALNDAVNTYLVCKKLDMKSGIENSKADIFDNFSDIVFREDSENVFKSKDAALRDIRTICFICPKCGEKMCGSDWASVNSSKVLGILRCKCGSSYAALLRFIKTQKGGCRVKRILYKFNDDFNALYFERIKIQTEKEEAFRMRRKHGKKKKSTADANTKNV